MQTTISYNHLIFKGLWNLLQIPACLSRNEKQEMTLLMGFNVMNW